MCVCTVNFILIDSEVTITNPCCSGSDIFWLRSKTFGCSRLQSTHTALFYGKIYGATSFFNLQTATVVILSFFPQGFASQNETPNQHGKKCNISHRGVCGIDTCSSLPWFPDSRGLKKPLEIPMFCGWQENGDRYCKFQLNS